MAAFFACCLPASVMAQSPVIGGGGVTSGQATITQAGNTTNVNQSTQAASINWQSFSIGSNSVVDFNQPSSTSVTLNRVIGTESSVIEGVLNANGHVFLLNGNGILMTKGSSVNTAGFVASTLDISDEDFKAGKFTFHSNGSTGSVINMGTITAKDGGYVALLGNTVSNQGVIVATKGTVAMAAGNQVTLNFNGNSLVGVTVDVGALNALVENKQAIYADGGTVILTAKAADDLLTAQVNNSGLIQARTSDDLKGDIELFADGGTVHVSGKLDASAPISGDGGNIETSGNKVVIADGATITTLSANGETGTWLIDPDGFTIASSGGDITGAELSKELATSNVTIASTDGSGWSGNLDVNDAVSWSANTGLTLKATNDININQPITATGAKAGLNLTAGNDININNAVLLSGSNAALTMNYGDDYNILTPASYAGAVLNDSGISVANTNTSGGVYGSITLSGNNASLNINGNAYTLIHSMSQLDALDNYDAATGTYLDGATSASTVTGYYALAGNLDASGATYANSPIQSFSGTFAGLGHTISNLTINAPTQNSVGLIGQATNSTLRDIGLTNANITGFNEVGALLGYGTSSGSGGFTVKDAYSTGVVNAAGSVGGLIGELWMNGPTLGTISYAYSSADVTSTGLGLGILPSVGGLVGETWYTSISHSDATGDVTSFNGYTGGLVGYATGAYFVEGSPSTPLVPTVSMSYATGNVKETTTSSTDWYGATGGLIGYGSVTTVTDSFAKGNVSGYDQVGGLMGVQDGGDYWKSNPEVSIDNTYATGNVTSIGYVPEPAYAGSATGGLIGYANGTNITNSFATGNVTSTYDQVGGNVQSDVGGLIGSYVSNGGVISGCHATGNVTGSADGSNVGGLIGYLVLGDLTDSYATGNVAGGSDVGGLVGALWSGVWGGVPGLVTSASITDSTAYGNVNGVNNVGGVVGYVDGWYEIGTNGTTVFSGTVSDVSSYGNVTGTGSYAGGIVGLGYELTVVDSNSYGSVRGNNDVGGIAGYALQITGSNAYGSVNSDPVDFAQATAASATMSNQTGNYTPSDAVEEAQAPGNKTDNLDDNIILDDLLNFSATIKTIVVDGVEYQVKDDSADQKQEKK